MFAHCRLFLEREFAGLGSLHTVRYYRRFSAYRLGKNKPGRHVCDVLKHFAAVYLAFSVHRRSSQVPLAPYAGDVHFGRWSSERSGGAEFWLLDMPRNRDLHETSTVVVVCTALALDYVGSSCIFVEQRESLL